jgi:hypothetical protein
MTIVDSVLAIIASLVKLLLTDPGQTVLKRWVAGLPMTVAELHAHAREIDARKLPDPTIQ